MSGSQLIQFAAEGFLYLALLIGTIYAVMFGYHWFSYGLSRKVSTTALIIFIGGGLTLLTLMLISALQL